MQAETQIGVALTEKAHSEEERMDEASTSRDEWLAGAGLTDREREVVTLVMEGKTFQEVSACAGVAPSTAKTYFQRSLAKLGVASRKDLAEQWAARAGTKTEPAAAEASRKGLLLAASQRACPPALLTLAFLLPQRIVHDGCIGWPVAFGCGIALLVASLFGRKTAFALSGFGCAQRGVAVGVVAFALATCVVLRALFPIEAWLDEPFAFVTALGATGLVLATVGSSNGVERFYGRGLQEELLSRVILCAICVLVVVVPSTSGFVLSAAGITSAFFVWRDGCLTHGMQTCKVIEQGPHTEQGKAPVLGAVVAPALAALGWAMDGSLGRPYTLGVPALVGVSFCCAALLVRAVREGKERLYLLACDVLIALIIAHGMPSMACTLVVLSLVAWAFSSSWLCAISDGHSDDRKRGVLSSVAVLIVAGLATMLTPPIASFYHALATSSETEGFALPAGVVLFSLAGCMAVLFELQRMPRKTRYAHREGGVEDLATALVRRGLSETQAAVLAAICAGKTSREIENELAFSHGTVNSARREGYRALGVHSADELRHLVEDVR